MQRLKALLIVATGALNAMCSAYIDDFKVSKDGSVVDPDDTAPRNTDDAVQNGLIECGIDITPPAGDAVEFCAIEAGTFDMGCDPEFEDCVANEQPQHQVKIAPFRIQRRETTIAAYRAFIEAVPEWAMDGAEATVQCDTAYLSAWSDNIPPAGGMNFPVLGVCWYAAEAFCSWLKAGYRLPTEAEWERVARGTSAGTDGGEYRIYPFDGNPTCAMANYKGCVGQSVEVGTRSGLAFGRVYDMGGNAWEWTADWYSAIYFCDPLEEGGYAIPACREGYPWEDPTGPPTGFEKVVKGGSWYHDMSLMRNASRQRLEPSLSSNIAGFRCASDD